METIGAAILALVMFAVILAVYLLLLTLAYMFTTDPIFATDLTDGQCFGLAMTTIVAGLSLKK